MKYFLIAGEKSGDLHGSKVAKAIRMNDASAEIKGWGGDAMAEAGVDILQHYKQMAFMGFGEVLKNLPFIWNKIKECKAQIEAFQPDAILYIDYSGFNLRIAEWANQRNYRNFYYIAPKTWAWNQGRTKKLARLIEHLFVILAFEDDFFTSFGVPTTYVGNPLMDEIAQFKKDNTFLQRHRLQKPIIALLPGSRLQEVTSLLPTMLEATRQFPDYQVVVAGVDNLPTQAYDVVRQYPAATIITNETYQLLAHAEAAIVASGTATLETALLDVPQVVVYRTSAINYFLGKLLIQVPYISLVNLIAGTEIVKELLQADCSPPKVAAALLEAIENKAQMKEEYEALRQKVGDAGASERVGQALVARLNNSIPD